jgi:hypothetical protein
MAWMGIDETRLGTDPNDPDTDDDGLLDGFEHQYGFNPLIPGEQTQDPDADGLDNLGEQQARTDPTDPDTDDDGLTDGQEVHVTGTDPRDPDTDDDGILDPNDNCPTRANPNQADNVHENGIGDACDDPDHDNVFDATDNCVDTPNANQANADGDVAGDACDAYPNHALDVQPVGSDFALKGVPTSVTFRLIDERYGNLLDQLTGVRVTLTVTGSAVFGTSASQGILVSGGGTNRVLVEFVHGLVTVSLLDEVEDVVIIGGIDSEHHGIVVPTDFLLTSNRERCLPLTGRNDPWQWGAPTSGPGYAVSGVNVWATNLSGDYPNLADAALTTQRFRLDRWGAPRLELQSWFSSEECCDTGYLTLVLGSNSGAFLESFSGLQGGYQQKTYSLSNVVGHDVQVEFYFESSFDTTAPGWYIDDLRIRGNGKTVEFLSPEEDLDGTARTTPKRSRRHRSSRSDTDDDGIADGPTTSESRESDSSRRRSPERDRRCL